MKECDDYIAIESPNSMFFMKRYDLTGDFFKVLEWLSNEFHKYLICSKPKCDGGRLFI